MSSCIVLGDKTVNSILTNLTPTEVSSFRDAIARSLVNYSRHNERKYQPDSAVISRPDGKKILFRCFTSPTGPGVKIVVDSISGAAISGGAAKADSGGKPPTLHGIVSVCDNDGIPKGLINADEITGFRTSMNVMIPFSWRKEVGRIVVFGAGKCALWHLRIALGLKGKGIGRVTVVNRSLERAEKLVRLLEEENKQRWKADVKFGCFSSTGEGYDQKLREELKGADAILCTTPSTKALFPAEWLKQDGGKMRPCFISGVGSWQPEMVEIDPELFVYAAEHGVVMLDDVEESYRSSGEVLQSGLKSDQLVELGLVLNEEQPSAIPTDSRCSGVVESGFMVYKSVGVSITDLAASNFLLELAQKQGKGVSLSEF